MLSCPPNRWCSGQRMARLTWRAGFRSAHGSNAREVPLRGEYFPGFSENLCRRRTIVPSAIGRGGPRTVQWNSSTEGKTTFSQGKRGSEALWEDLPCPILETGTWLYLDHAEEKNSCRGKTEVLKVVPLTAHCVSHEERVPTPGKKETHFVWKNRHDRSYRGA